MPPRTSFSRAYDEITTLFLNLGVPHRFPSPRSASETQARLKQALRCMPLESLDVNPFSIDNLAETLESRNASKVALFWIPIQVLDKLGDPYILEGDNAAALRQCAVDCILPRCAVIIDWLDFLAPPNAYVCCSADNMHLLVSKLLAVLHRLEDSLALSATLSMRMHALAFKLWFGAPTVGSGLSPKDLALYHEFVAKSLAPMLDMTKLQPSGVPTNITKWRDTIAEAALVVAKRPRAFFRLAVRRIEELFILPHNLSCFAYSYLYFLNYCAGDYLAIPNHANDVVLSLVQFARVFGELKFGHQGACEACGVLYQIWNTEKNVGSRALCWALRAGILPIMLSLHRKEGHLHLTDGLNFIAERSISVPVARALRLGGPGISCSAAGIPKHLATAMKECLVDRPKWQLEYWHQPCGYEKCSAGGDTVHPSRRLYHCSCLKNYCSAECQRAHWPEHKKKHTPNRLSGPQEAILQGELPSSDALFVSICADTYVCKRAPRLVTEALRLFVPKHWTRPPLYTVEVDFTSVPMGQKVVVSEGEPHHTEPMVSVQAWVNSSVGGWHVAIVNIRTGPLSHFQDWSASVIAT
ncbi:hypothetical protein GGF50DRAFT_65694 [Schizophyllum commune]